METHDPSIPKSGEVATPNSPWIDAYALSYQCMHLPSFLRMGRRMAVDTFCFRRALWQYLETRVTPLLAGVVAYTDTNANLDTLMNDGDNHWITSMWLDMFSNADITIIKYKLVCRTIPHWGTHGLYVAPQCTSTRACVRMSVRIHAFVHACVQEFISAHFSSFPCTCFNQLDYHCLLIN